MYLRTRTAGRNICSSFNCFSLLCVCKSKSIWNRIKRCHTWEICILTYQTGRTRGEPNCSFQNVKYLHILFRKEKHSILTGTKGTYISRYKEYHEFWGFIPSLKHIRTGYPTYFWKSMMKYDTNLSDNCSNFPLTTSCQSFYLISFYRKGT